MRTTRMTQRTASIMIIDDFEPDIIYATIMLEQSGRWDKVIAARSAREALDLFKAYEKDHADAPDGFPPLAILLDINMPGMNGFDFLTEFEATYSHIDTTVVFMLSSSESDTDINTANGFKTVKSFITKPLSVEMAVNIAEELIQ